MAIVETAKETKPVARMYNGYQLTDEQCQAIDLATTGHNLKIEAYAGAGKTSTLSAISSAMPECSGLYIAFNRSIADEAARTFPDNVACRTAHSLAFRAIGYLYKDRLQGRLSGGYLASEYLKITNAEFIYNAATPAVFGNMVLDTITKFCQSADPEINRDHLPWSDLKIIETNNDKDTKLAVAQEVVTYAKKTWKLMINVKKDIPVSHDVYLKLWGLGKPKICHDFILFDEAQDASPVMLDIVKNQNAQQIYVGDRYQQIYSFRGAVNAMQTIDTPNNCQISQSFRFGQPIANIANRILNKNLSANVNIRGFDKIKNNSTGCKNAVLCRTNGVLINELTRQLSQGKKIAVAGGCGEMISLLMAAEELQNTNKTNHRSLMLFKDWQEVIDYSETKSGADLALLVKLIDQHSAKDLITQLEKAHKVKENQSDLILSTAHKAKGREWLSVRLENDFRHPDSDSYSKEETNLLYVAVTRAKQSLNIDSCEAVKKALEQ